MSKDTVYEIVTEKIVEQLERGTAPWRKPWTEADRPRNLVSNRPYTGINHWLLVTSPYASPYWLTFKQIDQLGGTIREADRKQYSIIVFWKMLDSKETDDNGRTKKIPLLRYYRVWNLEQTEGVRVPKGREAIADSEVEPIDAAAAIWDGYTDRPALSFGAAAFYSAMADEITVPALERYSQAEEYYSTLFHEAGHSTGHSSRLNRSESTGNAFGSHAYGKEELIAEMAAAFLCGEAGIVPATIDNSAAYLAGWVQTIKGDVRMVVTAAGAAQRAADFVLGKVKAEADAAAA